MLMVGGATLVVNGQHREDRFNAARAAEQMAGHGLGRADDHLLGVVAKGQFAALVSFTSPSGVEVP